jgi:CRISPR-associated protein Cmr3
MLIAIEAIDTLIFRDGKPFGGDEDTWANTNILPSPSTVYGALRAIYFSQNLKELKKANTNDDPTRDLKIKGIYLEYKNNIIFPIPLDTIGFEEKGKIKKFIKNLLLDENNTTNNKLPYIFTTNINNGENFGGFLKRSIFKQYLEYKNKDFPIIELNTILQEEAKIGIGLNKTTKSVEDGKLYRIGLNRYKDLKILVDFEGLNIEEHGIMRFGGEAKGAIYNKVERELNLPKIDKLSSNRFKLYLLTPAIFKKGWLPDFININSLEGEYEGVKLKLIASASGKPKFIGGWDIKENSSKPMYKAVPAGSVYYFEFSGNEGDKKKIREYFSYNSISDFYQNEGYGITLVGDIK